MLALNLSRGDSFPLKVLCLGSHSDDIEIGCGGTILQLLCRDGNLDVSWVIFSSAGSDREREARASAALFLEQATKQDVIVKDFRDGFFPYEGGKIKEFFEQELAGIGPDLIFTHSRMDAHQDHRLIAELTWNTFRDHLILEYEIPKYDGDLGQPSVFVPLDADVCKKKIRCLMEAFPSQRGKPWFHEDTFFALMRLRGMECRSPSGHAEAFYCRKLVL